MRRYTPGEPAAWTMCGRISLFHTGVTAVRQSSQPWLFQTSSDAISCTVVYLGPHHRLETSGTDVARNAPAQGQALVVVRVVELRLQLRRDGHPSDQEDR